MNASATNTIRLHRVLRATPDRIYNAFLNPAAIAKWLPPNGYTCTVHELDAREGGSYRMAFTDISTGHSHVFGGIYRELKPGAMLRYTDTVEDPALSGEMQTTVTLTAVSCGTEVHIVQEGVPAALPAESCYLGWQQSLVLLGLLVEQ